MPELPEVETVKQRLKPVLNHQIISQIHSLHPKSFIGNAQSLIGQEIQNISRRAKILRIHLQQSNLLVHLKMTGQLIFVDNTIKLGGGHPTADWVKDLPGDHTRVIFDFKSGAKLFFNDMRIFGWIKQASNEQVEQELSHFGPDAIDKSFTAQYLQTKLAKRTIPIKQAIMISEIVGGVGNIYASEALFVAGIDPTLPSHKLSLEQLKKLVTAIKQVIQEGIRAGGTTFDGKFVDVSGLAGQYQEQLRVYGREGEACLICQAKINKLAISNRGTYYCSNCQNTQ